MATGNLPDNIDPNTGMISVVGIEPTKDCIERHRNFLIDSLDPDCVLDKLLSNNTFTYSEISKIKSSKKQHRRTENLVNLILTRRCENENVIRRFIEALTETNQSHLANFLRANGNYNEDLYADNWPLIQDQINVLNINQGQLIDMIDPCVLLDHLFCQNVINERQHRIISAKQNDIEKNEAILHRIRCGSIKDFETFIDCLRLSEQGPLAEIFLDGGALFKLRATIHGDPPDVSQYEDQISSKFANTVKDNSIEEVQRILKLTELKVVKLKKGKSIYLYVYCKNLQELMTLYELLLSGEIKKIVERLFQKLLSSQEEVSVSISHSEEDFKKLESFLKERESKYESEIEESKKIENEFERLESLEYEGLEVENLKIESFWARNRELITSTLNVSSDLLWALQKFNLLNRKNRQVIAKEENSSRKTAILLDALMLNKSDAFYKFFCALVTSNQFDLVGALERELTELKLVKPGQASMIKDIYGSKARDFRSFQLQSATNLHLVNDLEKVYPMSHKCRGRALIIANHTDTDISILRSLYKLFKQLSFIVDVQKDLRAQGIRYALDKERQRKEHKMSDMFVLFILSYGNKEDICCVGGERLSIEDDIINPFSLENCPALNGKPKIFFIQIIQCGLTCRPKFKSEPFAVDRPHTSSVKEELENKIQQLNIQDKADFIPGYLKISDTAMSYVTNTGCDSSDWFGARLEDLYVRCLVSVISRRAHSHHLLEMLNEVKYLSSKFLTSKLSITLSDTLTKKLYFFPGASAEDEGAEVENVNIESIWAENRDFLTKELRVSCNFLQYLRDCKLISETTLQNVENEKAESRKAAILLDALLLEESDAFSQFIRVLVITDQVDLAQTLEHELAASKCLEPVVESMIKEICGSEEQNFMSLELQSATNLHLVNDLEMVYPMSHKCRGRALIICNYQIFDKSVKSFRNLHELFEKLTFSVGLLSCSSAEGIRVALEKERQRKEHKDADMFILVISFNCYDWEKLSIDSDITNPFSPENCPALNGKPKVFFIQLTTSVLKSTKMSKYADKMSDTVVFVSIREPDPFDIYTEDMYVRCLCAVISRRAHSEHLIDMLNEVKSLLSALQTSRVFVYLSDALKKKLYFFPGAITSNEKNEKTCCVL